MDKVKKLGTGEIDTYYIIDREDWNDAEFS